MKEWFYLTKQKATADLVFDYVYSKRPDVSKRSIDIYLTTNSEFVRISQSEYELAEWGGKPYKSGRKIGKQPSYKNTKRQVIQACIESYLMTQIDKRALVSDVLRHVNKITKCLDKTFYRYLSELNTVRKETIERKLYCYIIPRDVLLFISYSHKDNRFVDALELKIKQTDIPYYRDVHDLGSGPMESQIRKEIHQRIVLLILSKNSTVSDWVQIELEYARDAEKEQGRYVLCPIALDDSWNTSTTTWPDRLISQIKKYAVIDFSSWQNAKDFDDSFHKLKKGLETWYRYEKI